MAAETDSAARLCARQDTRRSLFLLFLFRFISARLHNTTAGETAVQMAGVGFIISLVWPRCFLGNTLGIKKLKCRRMNGLRMKWSKRWMGWTHRAHAHVEPCEPWTEKAAGPEQAGDQTLMTNQAGRLSKIFRVVVNLAGAKNQIQRANLIIFSSNDQNKRGGGGINPW